MAELILALDLPTGSEAERMLDRLPGLTWVKVGPILMVREGPDFIRRLVRRGLKVFLDLKWHDIPNTVAGAVSQARDLGVSLATVHALGGTAMLRAAAEAGQADLRLVAVTVLTSHDAGGFGEVTGRGSVDLITEASRLAQLARAAGLAGVVCSEREVAALRQQLGPEAWVVVPGIRRPSDSAGDQVRTATPQQAVRAGASHLVVGRPILLAADPRSVFEEMREAAG